MKNQLVILFGLAIVLFSSSSCHDEPYVFKAKTLQLQSPGKPILKQNVDSSDDSYESCTVQNMEWTAGGIEASLLDPGANWCMPGNVLDAASLSNGKYTNIIGKRFPITLVINCPAFNKATADIESPTLATLTAGVDTILRAGTRGDVPEDFTMRYTEIHSEDDLKLFLGASYSGGMGSVSAAFDFTNKKVNSRYLIDIAQVYYTIFVDRGTSMNFFKVKPENWDENSHSPSPVYISQVKYGKRVMISIESSSTDIKTQAELRAKMSSLATSASLDANFFSQSILTEQSVKVLIKGGSKSSAYKNFQTVINHDTLYKLLDEEQWSLNNLGIPLSYQVNNVKDNSTFLMSETGKYVARNCQVKPINQMSVTPPTLEFLRLWQVGGGDRNFGGNPKAEASIKLEIDDKQSNIINAIITSTVTEDGGDGTTGYLRTKIPVVSMPDNFDITSITSSDQAWVQNNQLQHQGANPYTFSADHSAASLISIIGDSPNNNDDDLFPAPTKDDNHCEIRRIDFFPVKFEYTLKK